MAEYKYVLEELRESFTTPPDQLMVIYMYEDGTGMRVVAAWNQEQHDTVSLSRTGAVARPGKVETKVTYDVTFKDWSKEQHDP